MSQTLTPSVVGTIPHPAAVLPPLPVPLDERGVIRGASWDFYDRLSDAVGTPTSIRMAYDGKDIEIMVVGPTHDGFKELLGIFINDVAMGIDVDCEGFGSTTWKRPAVERGVEADNCYYCDSAKIEAAQKAFARHSNDVADYPDPDLIVEVDISPPLIDRPGIYAALKVPEVWRVDGDGTVSIERLGDDGIYAAAESSGFLRVRADEVTRWLADGRASRRRDWRRRLKDWVEGELKPRIEARP
jgi:Uma2 family endonuclease